MGGVSRPEGQRPFYLGRAVLVRGCSVWLGWPLAPWLAALATVACLVGMATTPCRARAGTSSPGNLELYIALHGGCEKQQQAAFAVPLCGGN